MTDDTETTVGGTVRVKRATALQAQIDATIPKHRQETKASDTQKGLLIAVVGVAIIVLRWKLIHEIPWWLGFAVIGFGGWCADTEWMQLKAKLALAQIGDGLDRFRGTTSPAPPAQ